MTRYLGRSTYALGFAMLAKVSKVTIARPPAIVQCRAVPLAVVGIEEQG
jgi:hypothetical protein